MDTNVLLHQLDALQQFVIDIEHHLPFTLQIIIPGVVISELDRCVYIQIFYRLWVYRTTNRSSRTDRKRGMIKWRGQRVWRRRGYLRK